MLDLEGILRLGFFGLISLMLLEFSPSKELAKGGIEILKITHQVRKAVGSQISVSSNQSPLFEFQKCPSWGGKSIDLGIFEMSLGW